MMATALHLIQLIIANCNQQNYSHQMKSHTNSQQRFAYQHSTQASPFLKSKRNSVNRFILTAEESRLDPTKTTSIYLPKNRQQSITQRQIYSHEIISSIMRKRQSRSIAHQIGSFDPQIQLYSKPIPAYKNQANPQQQKDLNQELLSKSNFQESDYSQKIHKFNEKLNQDKPLSQRIQQLKKLGIQKAKSIRPKSAQTNNIHNNNKRISVSGLVTYDFQSVNARKSLGFKMKNQQEQLKEKLLNLTSKNKCCSQRHQAIMNKKSQTRARVQGQVKKAIFADFQTNTDSFLLNLNNQIKNDQKIYGQKLKKLNCIKQLMRDEGMNFNQAQQIIQIIQNKKTVDKKPKTQKIVINEQKQLANRKKVQQNNRVILRQLYFSD